MKITIRNNDEGFLGSESHDDLDVEKSISDYEKILSARLKEIFPEADIEHVYGPYSGKSLLFDDTEDEDLYWEVVSDIIAQVYEAGLFWAEKKEK